jgi:hypothetical protein
MSAQLVAWLLAGALLGSLWTSMRGEQPAAPSVADASCCADSCSSRLDALGLEPAQAAALRATTLAVGARLHAAVERCARAEAELHALLDTDPLDEAAVKRAADTLSELRAERAGIGLECVIGVRRVLSAEETRALCSSCGCLSEE